MAKKLCIGLCIAWLAMCPAGICWARLGETEAEILKRYGKPFETDADPKKIGPADKKLYFSKGDNLVMVVIFRGHSVIEAYSFLDEDGKTVPVRDNIEKAEALLQANAQGEEWVEHPAVHLVRDDLLAAWERSDDKAMAAVFLNRPQTLEVSSLAYWREVNTSEKRAKAGADGF